MTLSAGNKVLWSDIQSIYTKLNNCQSKFNITQTAAPSNPGVVKPKVMTDLKSFIFALSSNSFVGTSNVSAVFNLTNPTTGSLLKADPFNTMNSTLDKVFNICVDHANFGDFGNFGAFSDYTDFSNRDADMYCPSFDTGCTGGNWTCTTFGSCTSDFSMVL